MLFLVAACLINHGSFLQDMPSVERFDDTDFQALSRKIIESTAECAICLATLEVGEDGGKSVDLERCSKKRCGFEGSMCCIPEQVIRLSYTHYIQYSIVCVWVYYFYLLFIMYL